MVVLKWFASLFRGLACRKLMEPNDSSHESNDAMLHYSISYRWALAKPVAHRMIGSQDHL